MKRKATADFNDQDATPTKSHVKFNSTINGDDDDQYLDNNLQTDINEDLLEE